MKIFNIIGYWINTKNGESRQNTNLLCLRAGSSYDEVYKWAQQNKEQFFFRYDEVYNPSEINENNVKFDFSVKEIHEMYIKDIYDNEYKTQIDLIAKIEYKKVEIPIVHDNN